MKKLVYLGLLGLVMGCGKHDEETQDALPPEESRFVREIFATNLFEPTELVVLPKERVLFTQRRGGIKLYDMAQEKLFDYDSIPVFYGKEDGLMGVAIDPEFDQNSWIYFYYSPVGEKWVNRLSRFSFTASGLKNEKIVLEVPTQREECCHTGGSIEFGADGLLYLSTGDNTNPFNSSGYSPADESDGNAYWDAQRTSSNTNDLRGKILRIKPEADGSYTIPAGNLFEDEDPLTRPEIYVMGCRNPYRISVDARRGWLFWGDVGPDASVDKEERGPRGYDEFNVALKPGYFGWPLFVGDNYAYRKYDFARKTSGDYHNPLKPINNSPNNTGIQELPPANPAKIYYPYGTSDVFPHLKSGGRNAMAGPVYYAEDFEGQDKFPSYLDGRVLYFDWMRGYIYFLSLDEKGNPQDWYQFAPSTEFNNVIDIAFGPDGCLYMVEYGTGWFSRNENAKLSRFKFVKGNRPPVLIASSSETRGAAPLTVSFDASATNDPDDHTLKYEWMIDGQKITEPVTSYTFTKDGVYYPEIVVTDQKGSKKTLQFVVEVGNEPPKVAIELEGNNSFYWPNRLIKYEVKITDPEDEKAGGIDQSRIKLEINHLQSADMAETLGHQVPVSNGLTLMSDLDCKACHKTDGPSIGPSFVEVAGRYKKDPKAVSYLSSKIINGGGGVWGEQAMSAHPDLSVSDAEQIVKYILSLGEEDKLPLSGTYQTAKSEGKYFFAASYEDGGKGALKAIKTSETKWLRPLKVAGDQFSQSKDVQARNGSIQNISHKAWLSFDQIDLTDIAAIQIHEYQSRTAHISLRKNSPDGTEIGVYDYVPTKTGGNVFSIPIQPTQEVVDLYFVFENANETNSLMSIISFEFIPKQ